MTVKDGIAMSQKAFLAKTAKLTPEAHFMFVFLSSVLVHLSVYHHVGYFKEVLVREFAGIFCINCCKGEDSFLKQVFRFRVKHFGIVKGKLFYPALFYNV